MKTLFRIAMSFLLGTSLLCCASLSQGGAGSILTSGQKQAVAVTLQKDAVTALADVLARKPAGTVLTDAAAATLSSVAAQAQAQGGGTAVVAMTAAGQAALRDYLARASTTQELTDAGLAALQVLVK